MVEPVRAGEERAAGEQEPAPGRDPRHGAVPQQNQHRGTQQAEDEETGRRERERWPQGSYARFVCWYANTDNIVFPASTGNLPGADNRLLTGQPHVAMAFSEEVMQGTLDLLGAPTPPPKG